MIYQLPGTKFKFKRGKAYKLRKYRDSLDKFCGVVVFAGLSKTSSIGDVYLDFQPLRSHRTFSKSELDITYVEEIRWI